MSHIYAMQRANGDVFALDHHGRFRVPLFHSSGDAMIARSRNWEMLLFKPIPLDARLLKELVAIGGRSEVDFWLVNDPLANLNRGHLVGRAQLAMPMHSPIELSIPGTPSQSAISAIETWENEGGNYGKTFQPRKLQAQAVTEEKAFSMKAYTIFLGAFLTLLWMLIFVLFHAYPTGARN